MTLSPPTLERKRAEAKEFIKRQLANSRCESCRTTVDIKFSHKERPGHENKKMSHLVTRGYSVEYLEAHLDEYRVMCQTCLNHRYVIKK